ncbi:C-type lectin domain-containing protein 180-like [Dysidea avara]|uniref:C-type lectin domain-containing protein 180-like n=1 Tax=Dysidea avara TaxID=196820 RepID=UPI003332B8D2
MEMELESVAPPRRSGRHNTVEDSPSSDQSNGATHAVVLFDCDGTIALIPRSRMLSRDQETCVVKWPCGKLKGNIAFEGTEEECKLKETNMNDDEDTNDVNNVEDATDPLSQVNDHENVEGVKRKQCDGRKPKKKRRLIKSGIITKDQEKNKENKMKKTKEKKKKKVKKDDFVIHVGATPPSSPGSMPQPLLQSTIEPVAFYDGPNPLEDRYNTDEEGVTPITTVESSSLSGNHEQATTLHSEVHQIRDYQMTIGKFLVEIGEYQKEQFGVLNDRIDCLEQQVKVLLASGVARALTAPHGSALTGLVTCATPTLSRLASPATTTLPLLTTTTCTPVTATTTLPLLTTTTCTPVTATPTLPLLTTTTCTPVTATPTLPLLTTTTYTPVTATPTLASGSAIIPCTSETPSDHQQEHQANTAMSPDGAMNELIPSEILVPLIMKHKTRARLAVAMTNILFDKDTRINSNCRGRDKPALDPVKLMYIRRKSYECHKSTINNEKDNWELDCIKAIDSDARGMKRTEKNRK